MERLEIINAIGKLENIYQDSLEYSDYGCAPARNFDERLTATLGDKAFETLASLVNYYHWDGRINSRNRAWATGITEQKAPIGTTIHLAHLNTLIDILRAKGGK